jgi:hypothetical protein
MNISEVKMMNESVVQGLTSQDYGIRKQAEDKVNNYLRLRQREEGFARKFYDVADVTPSDLDKQVDTPLPVIVKDMEPNSAGAYTVPFGTSPMDSNLTAPRYRVMFDRIMSRRYVADVNELLTYDMDIRQIFNDFILKDILAEEDRKFMTVVDTIANVANPNTVNTTLESCLTAEMGGLDRGTLANSMRGLPSTNRRLNPVAALVNNYTIWDVVALTREEIGGDLAEDMFTNGFTERTIMGLKWNITIKNDLVADDYVYHFAAPKYLGDFFVLDNICMSTKHEDFIMSFYAYECIGATIANIAAVACAIFQGENTINWRTGDPL